MNFLSKPVIALATAAVIGASMMSPVLAASNTRTQHMRAPTVQQQMPADAYSQYGVDNAYNQYGNGSWSNDRLNAANNFGQGNRCFIDLGYGRYSSCASGSD
jgi:hypothetical protein